jgi:holin-like protein
MLGFLTLILLCQLLGELTVGALGVPVPGPVLGMVLLFLILAVRGSVPDGLEHTSNGLLRSMSLLFVPAGTGVVLHIRLLGEEVLPLGLALLVSTVVTIAVTAILMGWLGKGAADEQP